MPGMRHPSSRRASRPHHRELTLINVDIAQHCNGPTGEVRLNFFADYSRFDNRIETAGPDE